MTSRFPSVAFGVLAAGFAAPALADVATFNFAQVGNSYSAFMGADNPLVGAEIVTARIYLTVDIFPGSDGANFFTDISFPIDPFEGNTNALVLTGEELEWSGDGTFRYVLFTEMFNGHFVPGRYGAETPGEGYEGVIEDMSRIEFDYIPVPTPGAASLLGLAGLLTYRRRR